MKKRIITICCLSAIVIAAIIFAVVSGLDYYDRIARAESVGWGDSDGGRPSYTAKEISQGVLGDKIVFNCISDGKIGNEKNFVGARKNTGINAGTDNVWNGNEIVAEDREEYLVRIYVNNNNPRRDEAVAENVRASFSIPAGPAKSIPVYGFISSGNASPNEYWDGVLFTSDRDFHLEYVYGSAILENNGLASQENGGAKTLSDDIVTSEDGVLIGYDALNGRIPGGDEYSCYICVRVRVVYELNYLIEPQVRLLGEKEWHSSIDAEVGDKVEFQIQYCNREAEDIVHENVFIRDVLPENIRYIEGSTLLYNGGHRDGMLLDQDSDELTSTGINIGNYAKGANAYIRFTAEVADVSLKPGSNMLVSWARGTVQSSLIQNYVTVMVNKAE